MLHINRPIHFPQQVGGFDDNGEPRIERESGKCFMVEVEDRSAATLNNIPVPVIREWIFPGTHIISYGWRAYRNLEQLGGGIYVHSVIVHEQNFVDPNDKSVHTQTERRKFMDAGKEKV